MKIIYLFIILFTIILCISCTDNEENLVTSCETEKPFEDIAWLKKLKTDFDNDSSATKRKITQYNYKGKASDILDPNTSNAYKVFHQNPGDEIHSHKSKITSSSSGQNGGQNIYYKTVCVNQDYNEDLQRLIRTSDIWYLENNVAGFNQKKDTLYLDEYTNLNRLLPDGFGADIYENGAFYSSSDNAFFIEGFDARWEVENDSLYVTDYIDYMNYNSSWYHLGHRLLYNEGAYFFDWSGSHNSHKPVYTNINGEEWGTPYSDSFLLSLADKEKEMIIKALQKYSGKRKKAADELGISERTLYRKIKEYDINS